MRPALRFLLLLGTTLLFAAPAFAQAPADDDDEYVDLEEYVEEGPPPQPTWGHITIGIGARQMGEDDAAFVMSVETDIQRAAWPVGLVFNMNIAIGDGPGTYETWYGPESTTTEVIDFGIGARKVFGRGKPVQPFISVGGAVYFVSLQSCPYYASCSGSLDDDVAFGPFADAGLFFATRGKSVFGFRVRYNKLDVTLLEQDLALDGVDVQMSWGVKW
jgi:hypothetical protein